MPTRPPYPREARIVTVEKGNGDQTVTWYRTGSAGCETAL